MQDLTLPPEVVALPEQALAAVAGGGADTVMPRLEDP